MSANEPYDRFGKSYNVSKVLKHDDTFDLEAYNNYSPLYLPATYAMTYLLAFALSTCVIVHTALYHGKSLWNGVKKMRLEQDDIHAKLMRNYPEVPDWWYASAFILFFCLAVVAVEVGLCYHIFFGRRYRRKFVGLGYFSPSLGLAIGSSPSCRLHLAFRVHLRHDRSTCKYSNC